MGDKRLGVREDILDKITSAEADRVTRHLCTVYFRLLRAPSDLLEGGGLRLTGEVREGQAVSAWERLLDLVKVTPLTARKALSWLAWEGIIAMDTSEP